MMKSMMINDGSLLIVITNDLGGSINGGTPQWLVYHGKSHLEMDDLGGPLFQEFSM